MSTEVAYRSSHPDVLGAIQVWRDVRAAFDRNVKAFEKSYDTGDGVKAIGWTWPSVKITRLDGETMPEGWRRVNRTQFVPDKRTRSGKQAQADLDTLNSTAPRPLLAYAPGMPCECFAGAQLITPAMFERDGALYVGWASEPENVDDDIWERIKLSEYYTAAEGEDRSAA